MFSGIVSVIPWKDHFIQFILQIVVLIFHAENLIKKNIYIYICDIITQCRLYAVLKCVSACLSNLIYKSIAKCI